MAIDRELRAKFRGLLASYLGEEAALDPSDDAVAIKAGTAVVYVRLVECEPPVVRVFSPLLRAVALGEDLLVELNHVNARLNFVRLFWRDETVIAATELLATSLTETELGHACETLADVADYYDERLHERYGGELSFARD